MSSFSPSRWGILFLNLGTPKSTSVADVRSYLTEFLTDPFVIDIPWIFRQALVRGFIAPFRAPKSAELYKKIWTQDGSPLFVGTENFAADIHAAFVKSPYASESGPGLVPAVEWSFRYGTPDVDQALARLKKMGCDKILVVPMYPQYAESGTLTAFEDLRRALKTTRFNGVKLIEHYHAEDFYIDSLCHSILDEVDVTAYEHIMYSFHSLPLRQIKKTCAKCGDKQIDESSPHLHEPLCYRGQCLKTARLLHDRLVEANPAAANLTKSLTYQSRLGRTPWLAPQSEDRVAELAMSGVKRLIVVAPGFTVDCLETLEELDHALKTTFLQHGGESFHRVKCLNNNPVWVSNVHDHLSKLLNADYESEKEEYLHVEAQRTP